MGFRVGDIVARSEGHLFTCSNKKHGIIIGFMDFGDGWDWLQIEGEYYYNVSGNKCVNYHNPEFIVLVERPTIVRHIKKLEFVDGR